MRFNPTFKQTFDSATMRRSGNLPHVDADFGIYSVTYRLAGSIPRQKLRELLELRRELGEDSRLSSTRRMELEERWLTRYDAILDSGLGDQWLADPVCAATCRDALTRDDGAFYDLYAWCVMPNHVHVLFRLYAGKDLARVINLWKGRSARECNWILKRTGQAFWGKGYFDRLVRDGADLANRVRYVRDNPEVAGLKEWSFVRVYEDRLRDLIGYATW